MGFADGDCEGVKFVEELGMDCRRVRGEGFSREIGHGVVSLAIVTGSGSLQVVAFDDAAKVLVCDGDWMAESVEENGVGCFGTDAGKSEEACSQDRRGVGGKALERAAELFVEHGDEGFECRGLAGVKAGGLNEALQLLEGERAQAFYGEGTGGAQILE